MNLHEQILAFIALLAIVDPVGAAPLYLTFTENIREDRAHVAKVAAIATGITLLFAVLAGRGVLRFFNISLEAFRVAGGILLLVTAVHMLQAQRGRERYTPEEGQEAIDSTSVAIIPITMPLLAGPGGISTAILFGSQMKTLPDR